MSRRERFIVSLVLLAIASMASFDLLTDWREGAATFHWVAELMVGIAALIGLFILLKSSFTLRRKLKEEKLHASELMFEADQWRQEARKHVEGLSKSIDLQLDKWRLSAAEKEVAFLLLKGLSLKEIAEVRNTTEKTARVQSMAIYSKSALSGRSELSAFFLEDLLVPADSKEMSLT